MKYTFDARIRYSETDENGVLTTEALLDYFQDCSMFHSDDIGVGMQYVRELNLAWVLNSWQIDTERLPSAGERVKVGTFPYAFRHFLGYRNFWMEDSEGKVLAKASTIWTLLNTETGQPATPTEKMLEAYAVEEKLDMEYLPRKITLPKEEGEAKPEILISDHHLDVNHHVNNGQYVRMVLELMPRDLQIKRLRVEYKKQAFLGDRIYPILWKNDNGVICSLNTADGETYAAVEVTL